MAITSIGNGYGAINERCVGMREKNDVLALVLALALFLLSFLLLLLLLLVVVFILLSASSLSYCGMAPLLLIIDVLTKFTLSCTSAVLR